MPRTLGGGLPYPTRRPGASPG
ncbi:MAG: hypothetical protein JWP20_2092, partial [Roseomonas sp.]|nr:hypothetical protein [Roseomonas sp.]